MTEPKTAPRRARKPRAAAPPAVRFEPGHAGVLLDGLRGGTDTTTVIRSGRCPACTYLYGSPGHANSCG